MFLKDIKNSLNSIHQQFTKMRNEKKSVILTPDIIEKKHPGNKFWAIISLITKFIILNLVIVMIYT